MTDSTREPMSGFLADSVRRVRACLVELAKFGAEAPHLSRLLLERIAEDMSASDEEYPADLRQLAVLERMGLLDARSLADPWAVHRAVERLEAAKLMAFLHVLPAPKRLVVLAAGEPDCYWGLAELLCDDSLSAAQNDRPQEALELAVLARALCDRLSGHTFDEGETLECLRTLAAAHLANALRACGDIAGASATVATFGPLEDDAFGYSATVHLLAAGVARAERRAPRALYLLRAAEEAGPTGDTPATIEIQRALALIDLGRPAEALESIDRASALPCASKALARRILHNRAWCMAQLGRHHETRQLLPRLRELTNVGTVNDANLDWIEATLEAGKGERAKALALLDSVATKLDRLGRPVEVAIARLESALLALEAGELEKAFSSAFDAHRAMMGQEWHPAALVALSLLKTADTAGRVATLGALLAYARSARGDRAKPFPVSEVLAPYATAVAPPEPPEGEPVN